MSKYASKNFKMFSLLVIATLSLSTVTFGPMSALAQEYAQGLASSQGSNQVGNGMHYPCFAGNQTSHRMHNFGQRGNHTGFQFGQGNHTGYRFGQYGNHTGFPFGQYGNRTGFRMNPCGPYAGQTSNINPSQTLGVSNSISIPSWVKSNAKFWSEGQVGDSDFAQGMQYLMKQGIVKIPPTQAAQSSSTQIPSWVKSNAKFWSEGQITDNDFVKAIQYLVSNGIIRV